MKANILLTLAQTHSQVSQYQYNTAAFEAEHHCQLLLQRKKHIIDSKEVV